MLWANKIGEVCTEYTGGGVWVAYVYTSKHIYYCVDNACSCPDELMFRFDDRAEDVDEGICNNCTKVINRSNATEAEKTLLPMLKAALEQKR